MFKEPLPFSEPMKKLDIDAIREPLKELAIEVAPQRTIEHLPEPPHKELEPFDSSEYDAKIADLKAKLT